MNFTIEEINEAWIEFNRPVWIADNRKIVPYELEDDIQVDNIYSVKQVPLQRDFISWLISWKKKHIKKRL